MSVIDTLRAARALIADRKNWTKGFLAIDATHSDVWPTSKEATCWCAAGALVRVVGTMELPDYHYAREALINEIPAREVLSLSEYNDAREHADVLALFDRAIASAS